MKTLRTLGFLLLILAPTTALAAATGSVEMPCCQDAGGCEDCPCCDQ